MSTTDLLGAKHIKSWAKGPWKTILQNYNSRTSVYYRKIFFISSFTWVLLVRFVRLNILLAVLICFLFKSKLLELLIIYRVVRAFFWGVCVFFARTTFLSFLKEMANFSKSRLIGWKGWWDFLMIWIRNGVLRLAYLDSPIPLTT